MTEQTTQAAPDDAARAEREFIERICAGDLNALAHNLDLCVKEQAAPDESAQADGQPESHMSVSLRAEARIRELEAQLAGLTYAAHMPPDYPYGLPSWINQRLYHCYIEQAKDQEHWDALTAALDERDKAQAQLAEAQRDRDNQTKRADSYARTAQAVLRDAGPALVNERERVATLRAALEAIRIRANDQLERCELDGWRIEVAVTKIRDTADAALSKRGEGAE